MNDSPTRRAGAYPAPTVIAHVGRMLEIETMVVRLVAGLVGNVRTTNDKGR